MAHAYLTIPDHLKLLKGNKDDYHFFVRSGAVVSDPVKSGDALEFFVKNDEKGEEYSAKLLTNHNARQTHDVSILYCDPEKKGAPFPVAWINHTVGEAEYMIQSARNHIGDGGANIMMRLAGASVNTASETSGRHGVFLNLMLLPLFFVLMIICALGAMLSGLLGKKANDNADTILDHAGKIVSKNESVAFSEYQQKKSNIWTFVKWGVLLYILFSIVSVAAGLGLAFLRT